MTTEIIMGDWRPEEGWDNPYSENRPSGENPFHSPEKEKVFEEGASEMLIALLKLGVLGSKVFTGEQVRQRLKEIKDFTLEIRKHNVKQLSRDGFDSLVNIIENAEESK